MKSTAPDNTDSVLDAWDQVFDSQENIFAIATLLEDSRSHGDNTEDQVVSHIGRIIVGEARKLKAALDTLNQRRLQESPREQTRAHRKQG